VGPVGPGPPAVPVAPVGPVGPGPPAVPVAPVIPCVPVAPVTPVAPVKLSEELYPNCFEVVLNTTTFVSPALGKVVALIEPLNWIEPFEPEITIDSAPNFPRLTLLSEKTSITGIPEISFTENKDPERESVTENN
jgi:hypothetical protein